MPLIQDREIRIQGCAAYTEADIHTALAIAAAGGLPTHEIISMTCTLNHIPNAFAHAHTDSTGKVLITPAPPA
jgi:threonine dehydrogenase-like Zn-dependent dehydrogenase